MVRKNINHFLLITPLSLLDPNTVNWLKRNMNFVFGFPEIVRFSWSSCSRILEESAAPVNWNDPMPIDESISKKRSSSAAAISKQTTLISVEGKQKVKEKNYLSAYKCNSITEI